MSLIFCFGTKDMEPFCGFRAGIWKGKHLAQFHPLCQGVALKPGEAHWRTPVTSSLFSGIVLFSWSLIMQLIDGSKNNAKKNNSSA